jgi:hypothetical protein
VSLAEANPLFFGFFFAMEPQAYMAHMRDRMRDEGRLPRGRLIRFRGRGLARESRTIAELRLV